MNQKDKEGNPFPFVIDVWTCNRFSKAGGDLRRYVGAKLGKSNKAKPSLASLTVSASSLPIKKKNPSHFKNRTRNIEVDNGELKKIHIRLIDSINGKKVLF